MNSCFQDRMKIFNCHLKSRYPKKAPAAAEAANHQITKATEKDARKSAMIIEANAAAVAASHNRRTEAAAVSHNPSAVTNQAVHSKTTSNNELMKAST